MPDPAPVRVAVVGNSFASKAQLPALRWAGGNEVVGLAGADAAKARQTAAEWKIPHATDNWEELVELAPDLVLITTPVHLHAPMVRAFLETNAAILCEKPFTLDANEAADLTEAAAGRLALIDHQLRWSPWRRRLRELAQNGFLGDPWHGRVEMVFGAIERIERPYSWWYDAERGGGMLGAIGSHLLDYLQHDLGPVAAVRARLSTYVKERVDADNVARPVTADEHATLWLRMQNGAEIEIDANIMSPAGRGSFIEYVGSAGTLRLDREETLIGARHGDSLDQIAVDATGVPTFEELGTADLGIFGRILALYMRDVVDAVRRGGTELEGAATFADGLATMRILDAARQSAREERWIDCG